MSSRIMYLRDNRNQPIGCISISINPRTQFIEYGLSVLNPADKFDRKMARQLSTGRLVEKPETLLAPRNPTIHVVSLAIMRDLATRKNVPARAVKAAKLWLSFNDWKSDQLYSY